MWKPRRLIILQASAASFCVNRVLLLSTCKTSVWSISRRRETLLEGFLTFFSVSSARSYDIYVKKKDKEQTRKKESSLLFTLSGIELEASWIRIRNSTRHSELDKYEFNSVIRLEWLPLWFSGQSSGYRSKGTCSIPLSLVSTNEELTDWLCSRDVVFPVRYELSF
jgi:hypothetical protein